MIILAGFVVLCCAPLTIIGLLAPKPAPTVTSAQALATVGAGLATDVPTTPVRAVPTVAATKAVAAVDTSVPTAETTATIAPSETTIPATETPAPPAMAKIGDRTEEGGVALTVVGIERKAALNQFMKAKEGNEYIIAEVIIETTGRDTAPYNPFYFKVKDGDGREYNTGINVADDALKSGDLVKGDKVRGTVAFEVKKDVTGMVLSYEPIVILGGYEPIKVSLE